MAAQADDRPPQYHIYILTVWRDSGGRPQAEQPWRFSLESPRTGERRGFKNMTELLHYVCGLAEEGPDDGC